MQAVAADIDSIVDLLVRSRFNFSCERELQDGIETALASAGIAYKRECPSPAGRYDFVTVPPVASIVIEVKIGGSAMDCMRQISRYLDQMNVDAVIVVGTPSWLGSIPDGICGKPVRAVRLIGSMV
jgi:hypothetical protein